MNIAVVGSGYVGLVSAVCFAELGHTVVTIDNDPEKIRFLQSGGAPIHEEMLPELLARHAGRRLRFSGSVEEGIVDADVVFICVGTPSSNNGEADLSFVDAVVRSIARTIDKKILLVEKSTVPVRTCDAIRRSMVLNGAPEELFSVASNPEFLREGTAIRDFLYADRIVIGVDDEFSRDLLRGVYQPLVSGSYLSSKDRIPGKAMEAVRLIEVRARSAELIKHASNSFLAMKISFINAVANVAEGVGADIDEVCLGIGSDSRIGSKFLRPGIGYGGSCFPKDVKAFRAIASQAGVPFELLSEVMRINSEQRTRFLEKVRKALWTLRGKRIAVLGLAFKGGTDDLRESPAVDIIENILREGASVCAYDPAAMDRAREELALPGLSFASDPYSAIANADALLILTDWPEFAELDLERVYSLLLLPIVVDGRNLYSPDAMHKAGFSYLSVGREAVWSTSPKKKQVAAKGVVNFPSSSPKEQAKDRARSAAEHEKDTAKKLVL